MIEQFAEALKARATWRHAIKEGLRLSALTQQLCATTSPLPVETLVLLPTR